MFNVNKEIWAKKMPSVNFENKEIDLFIAVVNICLIWIWIGTYIISVLMFVF